jgi:hypothetical protein
MQQKDRRNVSGRHVDTLTVLDLTGIFTSLNILWRDLLLTDNSPAPLLRQLRAECRFQAGESCKW